MTVHHARHHRHSIRLKGYYYSQAGAYFITICTHRRLHRFGVIVNGEINLNEYGRIAEEQLQQIPARFDQVELGAFVVMPNHFHGILIINEPDVNGVAGLALAQNNQNHQLDVGQPQGLPRRELPRQELPQHESPRRELSQHELPQQKSLGDIVGAYKSLVATECLKIYKSKNKIMGKLWQRNYYERIIRDDKAFQNITEYIINNPYQWKSDQHYVENQQ